MGDVGLLMPSTDETLREAVRRALASDPDTAALDVRVGVLNTVAHLAGQVPSKSLWHRAEAVAARVAGVRGVVNRIEAPGAPSPSRVITIPLGEQVRKTH
jgi:osmotically-inducible protein OsmY